MRRFDKLWVPEVSGLREPQFSPLHRMERAIEPQAQGGEDLLRQPQYFPRRDPHGAWPQRMERSESRRGDAIDRAGGQGGEV
jgi:hypothetical protein